MVGHGDAGDDLQAAGGVAILGRRHRAAGLVDQTGQRLRQSDRLDLGRQQPLDRAPHAGIGAGGHLLDRLQFGQERLDDRLGQLVAPPVLLGHRLGLQLQGEHLLRRAVVQVAGDAPLLSRLHVDEPPLHVVELAGGAEPVGHVLDGVGPEVDVLLADVEVVGQVEQQLLERRLDAVDLEAVGLDLQRADLALDLDVLADPLDLAALAAVVPLAQLVEPLGQGRGIADLLERLAQRVLLGDLQVGRQPLADDHMLPAFVPPADQPDHGRNGVDGGPQPQRLPPQLRLQPGTAGHVVLHADEVRQRAVGIVDRREEQLIDELLAVGEVVPQLHAAGPALGQRLADLVQPRLFGVSAALAVALQKPAVPPDDLGAVVAQVLAEVLIDEDQRLVLGLHVDHADHVVGRVDRPQQQVGRQLVAIRGGRGIRAVGAVGPPGGVVRAGRLVAVRVRVACVHHSPKSSGAVDPAGFARSPSAGRGRLANPRFAFRRAATHPSWSHSSWSHSSSCISSRFGPFNPIPARLFLDAFLIPHGPTEAGQAQTRNQVSTRPSQSRNYRKPKHHTNPRTASVNS